MASPGSTIAKKIQAYWQDRFDAMNSNLARLNAPVIDDGTTAPLPEEKDAVLQTKIVNLKKLCAAMQEFYLEENLTQANIEKESEIIDRVLETQHFSEVNQILDFLRERQYYLEQQKNLLPPVKSNVLTLDDDDQPRLDEPRKLEDQLAAATTMTTVASSFNIFKKGLDLLDDVIRPALQSIKSMAERLKEILIGVLVGFCAGIVLAFEGYQAIKQLYELLNDPALGQRKTRAVTAGLTIFLAFAGIAISALLIIGSLDVWISPGLFAFSFVTSAVLVAVYSLALWRKAYLYSEAKNAVADVKIRLAEHKAERDGLLDKLENDKTLNDAAKIKLWQTFFDLQTTIESEEIEYHEKLEHCLAAERDVVFGAIEVLGSILVSLGVIFGIGAIVGGSIASMGALPLALLIAGAAIGITTKLVEHFDSKHEHAGYNWLKEKIISAIDQLKKFFSTEPKECIAKPQNDLPEVITPPLPEDEEKSAHAAAVVAKTAALEETEPHSSADIAKELKNEPAPCSQGNKPPDDILPDDDTDPLTQGPSTETAKLLGDDNHEEIPASSDSDGAREVEKKDQAQTPDRPRPAV